MCSTAPDLARIAAATLESENAGAATGRRRHEAYFRAIHIEKTMTGLILMLIVAVAVFNIVATLVMVVNDKRTDIAILRTLGLSPRGVLAVFMTQGVLIGWIGTAIGVGVGSRARPECRCDRAISGKPIRFFTSWILMSTTFPASRARFIRRMCENCPGGGSS